MKINIEKTNIAKIIIGSVLAIGLGFALSAAAAIPHWNVSGNYVVSMEYQGSFYPHDMSLTQDDAGNLTGNGGSPAGANVYTWVIDSGTVSGSDIEFSAHYTATSDAVTPLTIMEVMGTIEEDGTMSGTWSDNYQGGTRSGTWTTNSGDPAPLGTLAAEDFGVVNYDTGLGQLKGYTAGFGLTDATFEDVQSVVVKLYSGSTLLQTNTATAKVGEEITGSQISSPFDVSGTFNYVTDGYWTNVKETEYGQSLPATKVVATVTLANGKVVIAENTNLTGDPTTIYPPVTPTTGPTNKDQCKNNGWKSFTTPSFKNQGQCVSSVAKK